jgi:molecular chaperone IbpA
MSNSDFDRIIDRFNEFAVGFGPVFRDFSHTTVNYPPHNIITVSDNEFLLELAIAGFKKNEVTIQENQGVLSITATKGDSPESTYQYRGLAKRSFSKTFRIAEFFDIQDAVLEDGILTIKFVKNTPEVKPKLIMIK